MNSIKPALVRLLMLSGAVLLLAGLVLSSPLTPLAGYDCGCGGAQVCVTKALAIRSGVTALVIGGVLALVTGLGMGYVVARRRVAADQAGL
jgi:hypothetical protein